MLLCPVIDIFGSTLSFLMEAAILENGRHFRKCSPNVMFCTICTCHRCILSILSEKNTINYSGEYHTVIIKTYLMVTEPNVMILEHRFKGGS